MDLGARSTWAIAVFFSFFCVAFFYFAQFFFGVSQLGQLEQISVVRPRSTGAIAFFLCCFFPFCSIFFWRIDEVGGEERSGLPPNSSILIIVSPNIRREKRSENAAPEKSPLSLSPLASCCA